MITLCSTIKDMYRGEVDGRMAVGGGGGGEERESRNANDLVTLSYLR